MTSACFEKNASFQESLHIAQELQNPIQLNKKQIYAEWQASRKEADHYVKCC